MLVALAHAHQGDARTVGMAHLEAPQQLQPAKGQQFAAQVTGGLVEVGQGDDKRHGLAIVLGNLDILIRHQFGQGGDGLHPLRLGQGHKAPVVLPGIVEHVAHDGGVLRQVLAPQGAHPDPLRGPLRQPRHDARRIEIRANMIGQQVLDPTVALRFHLRTVPGPGVSHQYEGGSRKALHQQAHFLIDMQVEGPAHPLHALAPQPVLGGAEQGREYPGVVLGLQHAEVARRVAMLAQVQLIHLGRDPPHRNAIAAGDPGLHAGVFEEVIAG